MIGRAERMRNVRVKGVVKEDVIWAVERLDELGFQKPFQTLEDPSNTYDF